MYYCVIPKSSGLQKYLFMESELTLAWTSEAFHEIRARQSGTPRLHQELRRRQINSTVVWPLTEQEDDFTTGGEIRSGARVHSFVRCIE